MTRTTTTKAPVREIEIKLDALVWEFEMEPGYRTWLSSSEVAWHPATSYYMAIIETGAKARPYACFYEADGGLGETTADLLSNDSQNFALQVPWEIFIRCVERLASGKEKTVSLVGGRLEIDPDAPDRIIYVAACDARYRLTLATLEALIR